MRWLWQNLRLKISETIVADAFIAKYIGMKQIELIHFVFIGTNRTAPRVPWTDLSEFRGRPIQRFMDGFFEFGKILYFLHFHKRDDDIFLSMERKVRNPQSHINSFAWIKWSWLWRHNLLRNSSLRHGTLRYIWNEGPHYEIGHYAIDHYVTWITW